MRNETNQRLFTKLNKYNSPNKVRDRISHTCFSTGNFWWLSIRVYPLTFIFLFATGCSRIFEGRSTGIQIQTQNQWTGTVENQSGWKNKKSTCLREWKCVSCRFPPLSTLSGKRLKLWVLCTKSTGQKEAKRSKLFRILRTKVLPCPVPWLSQYKI